MIIRVKKKLRVMIIDIKTKSHIRYSWLNQLRNTD
jgi:hypothetical protein